MTINEIYELYLQTEGINTDTRKFMQDKMFFALKGANFNGNEYAEQAIKSGAKYAVVDEPGFEGPQYITVEDSLSCLQDLARHHRDQLDIPVIGITGSNGKTTTKELVHTVLSQKFEVLATEGNLNNHIGVPLTMLSIKKEVHDIAVIEMGANHLGEIAELCTISKPNFGILTNIGAAHLEGFGSLDGVKETKKAIYEYVAANGKLVFVNGDDPVLMELTENQERYLFGNQTSFDVYGGIKSETPMLDVFAQNNGEKHIISTQLVGAYNQSNILAAIAVGAYFEMPFESIAQGLTSYIPKNNRSQLIKAKHNTLLLDCYNANPTSMKEAIKSFHSMDYSEKFFILGEMREMGKLSDEKHLMILHLLDSLNIQDAILIGEAFEKVNNRKQFKTFKSTEEARVYLKKLNLKRKAILLKGSRGIGLEKLEDLF